MNASVRVMRSYDYCQFEVALNDDDLVFDEVNELRKQAAILVDEAVRQYKIAKKKEQDRDWKHSSIERVLDKKKIIEAKPQNEWTIEETALMRSYADDEFWKIVYEDDYYYEYDAERDHHFSMLEKFKGVVINP